MDRNKIIDKVHLFSLMTNVILKIACRRNMCRRREKGGRDGHRSLLYKYFHISQKLVVVISFFVFFFCLYFLLFRRFSPPVAQVGKIVHNRRNLVTVVLISSWFSLARKWRGGTKLTNKTRRGVVRTRLSK